MESNENKKELIEKQFQELSDKAKELYPNIDDAISTLNNMTAQTVNLQDYLNLTMQTELTCRNAIFSMIGENRWIGKRGIACAMLTYTSFQS